ncbi:MAG TPA: alkaline phosphatase family protein [Bryobacteraceae bacterium]|jgi:phospholipase C
MQKNISLCIIASLLASLLAPVAEARQGGITTTPIQHIVIIFGENISFDHYFGTYPNALNPEGEPRFHAKANTPTVNGLSGGLLTNNPNKVNTDNGDGAVNPFRLDRSQAVTADQNHAYLPEQQAAHNGLMDLFPKFVGTAGPPPAPLTGQSVTNTNGLTMGYYDGNTVTALWNYAQHFAMNDNSYGTTFGPSTPGAINLISGQTNGISQILNGPSNSFEVPDGNGNYTLVGDSDPIGDVCSAPTRNQVQFSGKNIGDLLSAAGISWGSFMGGFDLTRKNANGTTDCSRSTGSSLVPATADYIPHHAWFQYYASTLNAKHTRPSSVNLIGKEGDGANHEYDIHDFFDAVRAGNFPAVSFLKAPAYQDGHAGYSDPLDEQQFIVSTINFLQHRPEWSSTAVVIAYDDSDGWYDHQMGPIVSQSESPADGLTGPGACGTSTNALIGVSGSPAQGRCGYGPRLPLLVISPWADENFVDHTLTDQTSIIRFIEDNWLNGERIGNGSFDAIANSIQAMFDFSHRGPKACELYLNEVTGQPISGRGDNGCQDRRHRD